MKFSELAAYRPRIEAAIRQNYRTILPGTPRSVRPLVQLGRDLSLRGGKRFRAILLLAGYHIANGRAPDAVVGAAAGLEHFQSWMLIHDDIIDHATERRGGPAVHRAAAEIHRAEHGSGASEDYGEGIGITLGDLEEPFTVEAFLRAPVPAASRLAALAEYSRMTRFTAFGQLLDIRNGTLDPGEVREEDVLRVHELKSAVYTVVSPLSIGALLASSSPSRLGDLASVGTDLGVAFQLRDDVLGAGFDADESGKSSNDLVEGKRTLLVVRAWSRASPGERRQITRVLGHADVSATEVESVRGIIRSTGSLAHSERTIERLTQRALNRLERSRTIRSAAKPLLGEIAEQLVHRRR